MPRTVCYIMYAAVYVAMCVAEWVLLYVMKSMLQRVLQCVNTLRQLRMFQASLCVGFIQREHWLMFIPQSAIK